MKAFRNRAVRAISTYPRMAGRVPGVLAGTSCSAKLHVSGPRRVEEHCTGKRGFPREVNLCPRRTCLGMGVVVALRVLTIRGVCLHRFLNAALRAEVAQRSDVGVGPSLEIGRPSDFASGLLQPMSDRRAAPESIAGSKVVVAHISPGSSRARGSPVLGPPSPEHFLRLGCWRTFFARSP